MIARDIIQQLDNYAHNFRSVLLVGPRQSGKTTLAKQVFPLKPYVSLENPDERALALTDPRGFLNRFPKGCILDEIQHVPQLLNYMQEILDNISEDGFYILTGSNNLLLQSYVTQSLAGRIGVLELLPLSNHEIKKTHPRRELDEIILNGFYPEVIAKNRNPWIWYASYIRTYIERDVRQIRKIEDIHLFQKFLKLCAGSTGQILSISALCNACGINVRTAQAWLSVLESTFVIRLLPPFYENYRKRIVKSPKLYFYDCGLVCALLNIKTTEELKHSHFRGALAENAIIIECIKNSLNFQTGAEYYYWRENNGVEIDLIQKNGEQIIPIEIKSAQTFAKDFTGNLKKFMSYSGNTQGYLLYDGQQQFKTPEGIQVINWREMHNHGMLG